METMNQGGSRRAGIVWVPAIAAANVLVFLAFGLQGNGWGSAGPEALVRWGSNFGPRTLDNEPWRLASSMFLHGGAVHLIVNMITLVDLGRDCERFFGRVRFAALYLLSGLAGSTASVLWNPAVNSVGASGAICGLLGAMLVYMLDGRNRVPLIMLKSHATGIVVFLVYSIFMGIGDAPIDHAAHAGGLAVGAICGFLLSPWRRPWLAASGATALLIAIAAMLHSAPQLFPQRLQAAKAASSFAADTRWFGQREGAMQDLARRLLPDWYKAASKPQLRELASQWDEVHARFTAYEFDAPSGQARLHQLLIKYTDLQRRGYRALADMPPAAARAEFERAMREAKLTADAIHALRRQKE